ncbi:hypothetical protein BLGI_2681 [Brevibacillus laterosporus GI-9]|nr:hypothetical protein BLGI_2681 [Brevibacillus laterosporus GI-9]
MVTITIVIFKKDCKKKKGMGILCGIKYADVITYLKYKLN